MATLPICYRKESNTHPFPGSKPGGPRALRWTRAYPCVPHPMSWLPETAHMWSNRPMCPKVDQAVFSSCVHLGTSTHKEVSPSILCTELAGGSPGRNTLHSGPPHPFGSHHNNMASGFCLTGIGGGGTKKCVLRGLNVWGLPGE
jgi:hypothetical protein